LKKLEEKNLIKTVALLTDFGNSDHFVGVVKGKILKELYKEENYKNLLVNFIDITHEIPPQDVKKACLSLYFSYPYFPENTIFLCVVDPGVGTERKIIVFETKNYTFVAPDNGLLTLVIEKEEGTIWEAKKEEFFQPPFSSTFHARDLFAPLIAFLIKEKPKEGKLIKISKDAIKKLSFPSPEPLEKGLLLSVWYVDRFGNLITNLKKEDIQGEFEVFINNQKIDLVETYAQGEEGKPIALFSSEGLLEIAIKNQSAYKKLGIPKIFIKWKKTQ